MQKKVEITVETYYLNKALKELKKGGFPKYIRIGFKDGRPFLVVDYKTNIYIRSIYANSLLATLGEFKDVVNYNYRLGPPTTNWSKEKPEFIEYYLDKINIPEINFNKTFSVWVEIKE